MELRCSTSIDKKIGSLRLGEPVTKSELLTDVEGRTSLTLLGKKGMQGHTCRNNPCGVRFRYLQQNLEVRCLAGEVVQVKPCFGTKALELSGGERHFQLTFSSYDQGCQTNRNEKNEGLHWKQKMVLR